MAICESCGTQAMDGVAVCPACGRGNGSAPGTRHPAGGGQQPGSGYAPNGSPLTEAQRDVQDNKIMGVLAYILAPIPWFAAPNSRFARFHAREGMKVFIAEMALVLLNIIFSFIQIPHTEYILGIPVEVTSTPWVLSLLLWLVSIPVAVLAIMGIVSASQGKFKAPPFLDKIPLFKDK